MPRHCAEYALVYQGPVANVFRLRGNTDLPEYAPPADEYFPSCTRVLQHAYSCCEWFCAGLLSAGHTVAVYHCDEKGDCAKLDWEAGKGELNAHGKHPPDGRESVNHSQTPPAPAPDLLAAATATLALWEKHGLGDSDDESEPVYYALVKAVRAEQRRAKTPPLPRR
jgi:hypothetical protein